TGGHPKARREHSECQHQNAVKAQEPTKKLRRIDGIRGIERSDVSVVVRLKLRRPLRRFLAQPIDVGDPTVFNILRGEEYRAREQQEGETSQHNPKQRNWHWIVSGRRQQSAKTAIPLGDLQLRKTCIP